MKFGFDWSIDLKKMFETNGHIHVYSPSGRGRHPPGIMIATKIDNLVIC